jgi:6,7-dimethyl-8-ribityllumazine synthase
MRGYGAKKMLKKLEKFNIDKTVLAGRRIVIVRSLFNGELTQSLLDVCRDTLVKNGADKELVSVFEVPGALEIPIVCRMVAKDDLADVIIALGVIIRGDTYHFELVANETARGCTIVSQEFSLPIIFEVLAVNTIAQAKERCGNDEKNKGKEAAFTALKMLEVLNNF